MSLALLVLSVLGLGALLWWQRRRGPAVAGVLRVAQRIPLGPKSGLALVEAEGDRLLVAYGEGTPRLIGRLHPDAPEEGAP